MDSDMNYKATKTAVELFDNCESKRLQIQNIQKRIRFLQHSLVQLSFAPGVNRPHIYANLIKSLQESRNLLLKFKQQSSDI